MIGRTNRTIGSRSFGSLLTSTQLSMDQTFLDQATKKKTLRIVEVYPDKHSHFVQLPVHRRRNGWFAELTIHSRRLGCSHRIHQHTRTASPATLGREAAKEWDDKFKLEH
jgi:hypothetical protein